MTKIDIFSGFLGAGKTTLIKKLIEEAYHGEKIVLIENEFGEIGIDSGFLAEYDNESSAGALVGKSNGGIYENITNKANVTLTSEMGARVGGIIGSVFNDDIVMTNCVNQGNVIAPVSGNSCGAGGILAFVGYDQNSTARGVNAKFINCTNQGSVTNNPKNMSSHVYAGGIVGVKYIEDTTGYLIDCTNTGKIFAKTAYGSYYADRLQQNLHIIKSIPVRDEKELVGTSEFPIVVGKGRII